jgi:hypothetical protein
MKQCSSIFLCFPLVALLLHSEASGMPVSLAPVPEKKQPLEPSVVQLAGREIKTWKHDGRSAGIVFASAAPVKVPASGVLYLQINYLDRGYGRLRVSMNQKTGSPLQADRFTNLSRTDSGFITAARMRFPGLKPLENGEMAIRIGIDHADGVPLHIESVTLQDTPFDDAKFKFVISNPWDGPYTGPTVKPEDNTTLKGKVMAGYQGWFRTPNDPEGRGWIHWGNIQKGEFCVDMWPDVSQYPESCLEKAADVRLKSGKQAYLFSSAWPPVVNTHFRWMREHGIDGAFLQRFVSGRFHSVSGGPEWVLANVRAAANREGRIWAVEYDVSGCPDSKLLEILKTDWKWFVDRFKLLEDPNYAREGGKPVVFIWGMPFPNRKISPETANAVVDFFKNDPRYGGNHVIGGIPSHWRKMAPEWQEHFKKYDCALAWMSQSYAADIADFKRIGLDYYAHVKPGFSWANLKHLPSGDDTIAFTPRRGGRYYWDQISRAAQAGADRLFIGMFDEYDEATAIMPMSDDHPPTPVRPGVVASFHPGANAAETGEIVRLPSVEFSLESPPGKKTPTDHFYSRICGQMVFPTAGNYKLSVEGAAGDDVELFLKGQSVIKAHRFDGLTETKVPISVTAGESLNYRLEYRHRTGDGTLRLCWEPESGPRQTVPPEALKDAWGRFITNEGRRPDWWLELTGKGRSLIRRNAD